MRQNHNTIPWGPVIPHEVYEGYVAFCKRQRDRTEHCDFDRRHQERRVSNPDHTRYMRPVNPTSEDINNGTIS